MLVAAVVLLGIGVVSAPAQAAGGRDGIVNVAPGMRAATLRCRTPNPLVIEVCAIFLPHGERLRPDADAFLGDSVRWALKGTSYGVGDVAIFVKEKTNVPGITTTLYVPASGGMYRILVVSDPTAVVPSELHFSAARESATARREAARAAAAAAQTRAEATRAALVEAEHRAQQRALVEEIERSPCERRVDADYVSPRGSDPAQFAPTDVYNDGVHTCLELPKAYAGLAIPYAGHDLLHFRWDEARRMLIVDGLPATITLRDGSQSVVVQRR